MTLAKAVELLKLHTFHYGIYSSSSPPRFARMTRGGGFEVVLDEYGGLYERVVEDEPLNKWSPEDRFRPTIKDFDSKNWTVKIGKERIR